MQSDHLGLMFLCILADCLRLFFALRLLLFGLFNDRFKLSYDLR